MTDSRHAQHPFPWSCQVRSARGLTRRASRTTVTMALVCFRLRQGDAATKELMRRINGFWPLLRFSHCTRTPLHYSYGDWEHPDTTTGCRATVGCDYGVCEQPLTTLTDEEAVATSNKRPRRGLSDRWLGRSVSSCRLPQLNRIALWVMQMSETSVRIPASNPRGLCRDSYENAGTAKLPVRHTRPLHLVGWIVG